MDCSHIYVPNGMNWGPKAGHTQETCWWAFFYSGVDRSWLRIAQKWSILDQKWPNKAGLSTCQSGPKGSKWDQNGQPKCFWPFGTLLGPSGPFWTISNKIWYFAPEHPCKTPLCPLGAKNHFCLKWFKRVQMGPKWVPNDQKHLGWPFWSLSDPFGPLWSVDKPAMFGPFWSKMDHF